MKIYAMQFDYMLVVTALKIALNFTVQLGFGCVSVVKYQPIAYPFIGLPMFIRCKVPTYRS